MSSETPDSPADRRGGLRRVTVAGALLLILVLGPTGYAFYRGGVEEPSGSRPLDEVWLRKYPPVATPKIVDDRLRTWKAYVWVSTDERLCIATTSPASGSYGNTLSCYEAPAARRINATPALTSKPIFEVAPMIEGEQLAIGTVSGSAATVDVTMFDTTTTGTVVTVADNDEGVVGAYAVWLPVTGHGGIGWRDIIEVAARDDNGRVLDRIT